MQEEVWLPITTVVCENIKENTYMISNYERILNINTGRYLSGKSLQTTNGHDITISIARVEYRTFINANIAKSDKVLFKDNNPNNLYIENLYCVSHKEFKRILFETNAANNTGLSDKHMSGRGYYQNNAKIMCYYADEKWKDITQQHVPTIKPWYLISNYGRIYSKATDSIIKTSIINSGYERVQLISVSNVKIDLLVHRLVALVWIPNDDPLNKIEVNHKDENTFNNRVDNLEWVTSMENLHYKADVKRTIYYNITFPDNVVRLICEGLVEGMSYMEICYYKLHCRYGSKIHQRIWLIHKHHIHKDISKDYNF